MRNFIPSILLVGIAFFMSSCVFGETVLFIAHKETTKTIKVAVIDTGFDFESNWDRVTKTSPQLFKPHLCLNGHQDFSGTSLLDSHGHGTHIAGLIAQYAKNQDYCMIILKFFDPRNTVKNATVLALKKAVELNVDIINYSAGGTERDPEECDVIKKAIDKGIVVVTAAGNEKANINKEPYYPAMCDKRVRAVANVSPSGNYEPSSNFTDLMPNSRFLFKEKGCQVLSLLPNNSAGYMSGTSQSAAIRTGKIIDSWKGR